MPVADRKTLAVFGGVPVFPEGPPVWPRIDDEEVREAMMSAYSDGSWGRYNGPHGHELCAELIRLHHVEHVLLTCSGTLAVELALRAVGVQPQDNVFLAGYDFRGNFRAVEAVGAWPVLIDISLESFAPTAASIDGGLSHVMREVDRSSKTGAIIISHLHGGLADMPAIMEIARRHGIPVVEDACQATGAMIAGQTAGTWGDVGVLSFGGSKLLTAGRGGAVLTQDARLFQRAKTFGERGNEVFPLSEIQAAVLLPQLRRLPEDNRRRTQSVKQLEVVCHDLPGLRPIVMPEDVDGQPSYYKMAWMFSASHTVWPTRESIVLALQAEGVAVGEGFRGFARRSKRRCSRVGDLQGCRAASEQAVLLHHPVLREENHVIDQLANAINKVVGVSPDGF